MFVWCVIHSQFFLDAKANDPKGDSYFLKFMKSLLALFSSDRGMQEERWAFIIRFRKSAYLREKLDFNYVRFCVPFTGSYVSC